jgi:hypothetical protein
MIGFVMLLLLAGFKKVLVNIYTKEKKEKKRHRNIDYNSLYECAVRIDRWGTRIGKK